MVRTEDTQVFLATARRGNLDEIRRLAESAHARVGDPDSSVVSHLID